MNDLEAGLVYEAETQLRYAFDRAVETGDQLLTINDTTVVLPAEIWFADQHAVQDYCDRVTAAAGWPRVDVFMKAGGGSAHYMLGSVHLPYARWAMRELVILHELAHHGVVTALGETAVDGHGSQFRAEMHKLVRRWMGAETALALRATYSMRGLQLSRPVV